MQKAESFNDWAHPEGQATGLRYEKGFRRVNAELPASEETAASSVWRGKGHSMETKSELRLRGKV